MISQDRQRETTLLAITERLRTQDNRATMDPMFCVQIKIRDSCYDPEYGHGESIWVETESGDYDEVPPNTPGAKEFGYRDRWETVMVAFTEEGCKEIDSVLQSTHEDVA